MDAVHCSDSLSLILPAFNEGRVIRQAVTEAIESLELFFSDFEILVVDDGSTDDTAAIVEACAAGFPCVRLLRHAANQGYGTALRTGFLAARHPFVAFTDADCQFDLRELAGMVRLASTTPIVVGYRANRQDSRRRRFLSRGYNRLARTLLDTRVRDVDCALKVFQRDVLAELMPRSRGFFVNTEMLTRARLLGFELREVPVSHRPRLSGDSKVSLREVPRTFRTMMNFWWREVVGQQPRGPVARVFSTRIRMPSSPAQIEPPPRAFASLHPIEPPESHRESA